MLKLRLCFITVWSIFDPIYFSFTRLKFIEKHGVFRVRLTRYKGGTVRLTDGTIIRKNDLLVKIHLHNIRLIKEMKNLDSELKKARFIYRCVANSLPSLANYVKSHPKSEQIKGIVGISALNKGISRLGFEKFSIHNYFYRKIKQSVFFSIYFLVNETKLANISRNPEYLLMSKDVLYQKYKVTR